MASYDAVIKLIVEGEGALKRIQERIDNLYKTISDLEKKKKFAGSEVAVKFVRDQADQLERVVNVSKDIIKQDEKRIIQQSKLNSAVDLYERRIKQVVNSGASSLKKFEGQIKEIEGAFKFFKDKGNVTAVQALATELGRMVEYANAVNRSERARASNLSQLRGFAKQLAAYEEAGLNTKKAREKFDALALVADTNKTNEAKKYTEALLRQLKLLKDQLQTNTQIVKDMAGVTASLMKLEEKQRDLANSKLDEKALQVQAALDRQAAAAAESAAQVEKLNQRQTEFIARTDAAAQAASRQTAEFIRQQRIAKEVAKINANAPAPQLLLAPAAPGAPAMGGGARARITGPVERLGGARTQDEADTALRFAQALKEQVRPLSQIQALYAGIASQAAAMQRVPALPSSAMLNAAARGIQNLETSQDTYNRELQETADRLSELDRLEASRARRAKKLQDIADYYASGPGMGNAGAGVQGPAVPPGGGIRGFLNRPGMADAIIGGSFPLLFGGGPGATIGGFAGGLAGGAAGGPMGMALSLGLSAVGQKLDQIFGEAIRATQELGKALSSLDATKLRETTVFVTAEFENQNRLLLEAGQYEQARAMATKQVAAQTGALGSSTADAANAANLLKNSFDNMMSPVNSLLASISGPFVAALAGILNIVGLIAKGLNVVVSGVGQLIKGITEWAIKLVGGQKALDRVREITKAASEQTEELRAATEAEIDAGVRNIQLKKQLLDIERQRLEGTNRIARASQIEADLRSKAAQIQADKENEIRQIYAEGSKLTEQQRNLKIQIAEATAEQKLQEAGITAEKARQKLLDDEAIAKLQMAANLQQAQAQNVQTLLSAETQRVQIGVERLQQEQQFALSLNQQTGLITRIAELRKQQAQAEYQASVAASQAAVQQAASELAIIEAKYAQNNADIEQLQAARLKLQNAQAQAGAETTIADLKLNQSNYMTEIEKKQQMVNAYAENYARVNAETTRKIEEQTNAINNRATLLNAISQVTQTINNIEIQSLERELERTTNTEKRKSIIEQIYKLEVENARVQLEATRANIQAELARADAAYRTVQLKYEELKAVVAIAQAEGVVTRAHFDALRAQESALRIAKDNLNTAGQVANWQWKAADAVFKAAVDAAKLKKETTGAAQAAGQFAGSMERAAGAMGGISKAASALGAGGQGAPFAAMGGAGAIQDPGLKAQAEKIWQEAERFAATKGIASIQADILQRARDAIARIAFRDYVLQQKAAGAPAVSTETPATALTKTPTTAPIPLTAPLATGLSRQPGGGPGTAIVDTFPTINLQTGPVLQQDDGSKYVSLGDLEKILQDFAAVVFNNARTAGGRQYQGVN